MSYGDGGSGVHTESTGPCTGPETLNGYTTTSDARTDGMISVHSCAGYTLVRTEALAGQDSHVAELPSSDMVYFTGAGCMGSGYVSQLSADGVIDGTVFTMNTSASAMNGADWSNPANYWYVPAGSARTSFTAASVYQFGIGCTSSTATSSGFPILPNDYNVTAEQSAPKAGPVAGSTP